LGSCAVHRRLVYCGSRKGDFADRAQFAIRTTGYRPHRESNEQAFRSSDPLLYPQLLERVYSIGPYPAVSLDADRTGREAVKAHLREGRDPIQVRRQDRAAAVASSSTAFA